MKLIKNLKIRDKLLLLLSLLLLPLLYFTATTVRHEYTEHQQLQEEARQLGESEKLSELIHAFQKERGRMLMAAGGRADYLLEAKNLRPGTDAAATALKAYLQQTGKPFPDLAWLNELDNHRHDLDQNKFQVLEFRKYSNKVIFLFLDRIDANATSTANVDLGQQLSSFRSLVEAKIQLSRMRNLLMKVLQDGRFSYEDYAQIRSQEDFYTRALGDFLRYADTQTADDVQQVITSSNYATVAGLLQSLEKGPDLNLPALQPDATFNAFTRSIEGLRLTEKRLLDKIEARVQAGISQKQQNLSALIAVVAALLVLVSVLSYYIINLIATSLSTLRAAAERIRLGATDVVIPIDSEDEVGLVAESFRGVLHKQIGLSQVAQAIGRGRYDLEVQVQSQEDVLGLAIREMQENLKHFTTDNANRNWILTGVSELNNLIAGETSLERVAEKALNFICSYSNSEAGIFYLHQDSGLLHPAASHGVAYPTSQLEAFPIGTGLVGQAVSLGQVKLLHDVAAPHLKIKTGLSESDPAQIIVLPLAFTDKVVGALELCSRQSYSEPHQEFFRAVAERVAVVVHTLHAHLQTQELLYETQNQAEELETQQEELRQLNTELKASEEELRVSQEELQEKNTELEEKAQLLEEQYETLRSKNLALEDARQAIELKINQVETVSKYKSEFLANMSHELRTPLNSILILSRLLADNTENVLSTKQVDHAQIIHRSGNDLLKLINEILDLSKIESGLIRLEVEEVPVQDIQLEPLFREMAHKKNIRLSQRVAPGTPDILETDRFRLEQILKNFIGNAIKFTPEGGEVELLIYPVTQQPGLRTEGLQEQSDLLAFAVKDNGIGIAPDKQELVFEAFQQADASTTRKYGGTGLGLTISRELATLLGGELQLESQPGQGSTFTLYLPRHAKQQKRPKLVHPALSSPEPKAGPAAQLLQHLRPKAQEEIKVLIVEDDKGFSDILADFATAKSFRVLQAYTGQEGLRLARAEQPDAILLDIHLPDISGWEVLRLIREDKDLRQVNVHVMSAYDNAVFGEAQEEYLPKPVTLEMLNKAFSSIAGGSPGALENILIVEDNEVENKAVSELLLAHGMRSTSAYTAEEAAQVLARQPVDCIILDLNLPGQKGYDFMKELRAKPGLAAIPIIIYSGKELSEEEENRLKAYANTIIIKNEYSYLRLLDEVQLFLHKVNQKLPSGKEFKMKLHVPEQILQQRKVLVVDDDIRNVYSLSSLLELHGMDVVVAHHGKEALEKLQAENGVELVLMDIMMPEMDGITAIEHIRSNPAWQRLPVIALTAKAMKEDKEKCLRAGASDYIAKPIDTEKLLTLMRVWLYEA